MFNFKELFVGIVLILLLGIGGFIYRAALEQPYHTGTACTLAVKICPDGTLVGRVGNSCTFASCPKPKSSTKTASSSPNSVGNPSPSKSN